MPISGRLRQMYLVVDTATNNVLAEYDEAVSAEQRRIQIVGANPHLAEYIEVVDLDAAVAAHRRDAEHASAETQPA
jgi:hypothetical protein